MRTTMSKLRLALSASTLTLAMGIPGTANAATCNWLTAAGNWATGGNWSCGVQPTSADDAVITGAGAVATLSGINAGAATINLGSGNAINITNGSTLAIYNSSITNNGIFTVASNSDFRNFGATLTVGGTGSIILDTSAGNARLFTGNWIFGGNQTVAGSGQLGLNQTTFTNNGLISANVNGGNLSVDVSGGSGGLSGSGVGTGGNAGFFNTGTMQATGGGTLSFESGLYENGATGVILAANGSAVRLNNDARIVGGTLTTTGTGQIQAVGATQYLTNVTLSSGSNLLIQNDNLYASSTLTNNGTITLAGAGGGTASLLNEGGTLTFGGNGTIVLDSTNGGARIYNGSIVFGSNQSLRGSGQLGINQTTVTNNGLFSANTGSNLSIDVSGGSGGLSGTGVGTGGNAGLINNGIMEATGNSTISIEGGLYENAVGGIIRATNGSTISLNSDSRIVGGTLTSDATSVINAFGTTQYLTNVTLSSGSNLRVQNDSLVVDTRLTNNGTITLAGAGGGTSSLINQGGNLLIDGAGTIVLDSTNGGARIYNGNITFGAGTTVQGAGQLGINQTTFSINNVFSANSGSNLSIDVSGGSGGLSGTGVGTGGNAGLINSSTIQATGGSTVSFESGLYENSASGVILAANGSVVSLNADSRILGGTLTTTGTGLLQAYGTTQYLTNVTLSSGSNLRVRNDNLIANTSLVNNGTITLAGAGGGTASLINESGSLTLTGSGSIVLDSTDGTARIYSGNIVFGSNQSVRGSGQLGINQTTITNNGLFSANTGSNLQIDSAGGSGGMSGTGVGTGGNAGLINNGIMEATGNSTIIFESGLYENAPSGVIRATSGSTIYLNPDSRIVGGTLTTDATSVINAFNTTQYLTNVTLSSGSNLRVQNDNLYASTTLTNNGTITLAGVGGGTSSLLNEGGNLLLGGTGTIVLDNSAGGARIYNSAITFGPDQTVRGSGQVGINQTIITNNGFITADAGTGISIDVAGGSGGLSGGGVGTGGNAGLLNRGVLSAVNGSTLALESGLYENDGAGLGGELFAGSNSTILFNGDANFVNLRGGGILDGGRLYAEGYTGAGTINLRSGAANLISTIGAVNGPTTEVILQGAGSTIVVTPFSGGVPVSIDQTLQSVAGSGVFAMQDRNFTVVANSGNFSNAGLTFVNNTVFTAASFTNSGQLIADATSSVVAPISNSGLVHVATGTLTTQAITGPTGTITIDSGAQLRLGGTSTTGTLNNNGTLALGANNITVSSDYTNANFGAGNAFNGRANVTGAGLINASSATQTLSGPNLVGNTLNVGNVRTGGSSSTTLTITNNGTDTVLRGAVQNGSAPSVALSNANFVLNPNGGSSTATISYTGVAAGSLSGQSLNVVNNFSNVGPQTVNIVGNIYQVAQAGAEPASVILAARRVGDAAATSTLTIANVAPVTPGFNEALRADASANGGFLLNGGATSTVNNLAAGSSTGITLSRGTGAAGTFSGTVSIANTSLAVAGSGLADLPLAGQSIAVSNKVYALAVANVATSAVNFGTVRKGAPSPTGGVGITNGATGALTDTLLTSVGATPANIVAGPAPAALASGQSGSVTFSLNTAQSGIVSGSTALGFTSHDSDLADVVLGSQTVNFSGTVTELAAAAVFKNAGAGAFSGSGTSYSYDLGTLATNSGSFSTDFGIANIVALSSYSETLGGSFSQGAGTGYTFNGNTFAGVQGGSSNLGNLLVFDTTGLSNGTYGKTLTFNGYSAFTGLANQSLSPISINIIARITGGTPGAVPEPGTWVMMILGFGLIGAASRRTRRVGVGVATIG